MRTVIVPIMLTLAATCIAEPAAAQTARPCATQGVCVFEGFPTTSSTGLTPQQSGARVDAAADADQHGDGAGWTANLNQTGTLLHLAASTGGRGGSVGGMRGSAGGVGGRNSGTFTGATGTLGSAGTPGGSTGGVSSIGRLGGSNGALGSTRGLTGSTGRLRSSADIMGITRGNTGTLSGSGSASAVGSTGGLGGTTGTTGGSTLGIPGALGGSAGASSTGVLITPGVASPPLAFGGLSSPAGQGANTGGIVGPGAFGFGTSIPALGESIGGRGSRTLRNPTGGAAGQ